MYLHLNIFRYFLYTARTLGFHEICLFFYLFQDGSLLLPRQDLDLSQVTGIICRLLANGQVAHSWCVHKSHGFLSSWAVGSFLLVTQTDLKVIPARSPHYLELL